MTDEEKLIQTRNFVRYMFSKLDNEIDIKIRNNPRFFSDLVRRAMEVGVIKHDGCRYILTDKEQENWHRKRARHLGKHPREKHTLL